MRSSGETMNNQFDSSCDPSEEHVFCPEQLLERCLGKIDFAKRVLDVYLSNVHHDVDELLEAVRVKDNIQVVQTAHRMKGSAANIAAERMQRLMTEIEEAGRLDDTPEIESLQQRVHTESQSLERVLLRWRSEDRTAVASSSDSLRRLPQWRSAF
jgi:HPt (histidine-containing phosphotransfer) domain-containing protein